MKQIEMKTSLTLFSIIFSLILVSCNENHSAKQHTATLIEDKIVVTNNGIQIDYNIYGEGDITLLLVHGWCMDQTYWENQLNTLVSNHYKVVTMDLPGFGKSGKNRDRFTIEAYADDINALSKQLQLKDLILIGHSMSGNIILEAALQNKEVIALIGIDNFKTIGEPFNKEMQKEWMGFLDVLKQNFSEAAPEYIQSVLLHPNTDSLIRKRILNDIEKTDPKAAISSLEELFAYIPNETKQLKKLEKWIPFYLINSDMSPTNKNGLEATGIPYRVVEIANTGHYPMLENPVVFNGTLINFIYDIDDLHNLRH